MNDAETREKRSAEGQLSTAELASTRRVEPGDEQRHQDIIVESQKDSSEEKRDSAPPPMGVHRQSHATPMSPSSSGAGTAPAMAKEPESGPLFSSAEAADLRGKWDAIQVGFVDEPRRSVQEADSLVAVAMKRLAEQFAAERSTLEGHWDRGGDVSTEDLRIALRRYRSFFGRLLSV